VRTSEAIDLFLADCRRRPLSAFTLRRYAEELARLPDCELPPEPEVLRSTLADPKYSRASRQGWYRTWRQFFAWLWLEHHIETPMVRVQSPRGERIVSLPFTREELQALFRACLDDRHRALLLFLLDTGCRRGEVASLRRSSLFDDAGRSWAVVSGKTGPRPVPMSLLTAEYLRKIAVGDVIWADAHGRPLDVDGLKTLWRRLVDRSGIRQENRSAWPAGIRRRRGLHTMRRTAAREHWLRGMDMRLVQHLLGHARLASTQGYLWVGDEDLARVHAQTSPVEDFREFLS
jgi:integrase